MSFDSFSKILNNFASKIGLGGLKIDESGYCCLDVDHGMFVHLKHEPKRDNMIFLSELGELPASNQSKVLRYMLLTNDNPAETKGMTLSYNAESNKLAIGYQYPLQFLDDDKFEEFFKLYLDEIERWTKKVSEFNQGIIPEIAGDKAEDTELSSSVTPPPFMVGA